MRERACWSRAISASSAMSISCVFTLANIANRQSPQKFYAASRGRWPFSQVWIVVIRNIVQGAEEKAD
jgi:hypothetical protein